MQFETAVPIGSGSSGRVVRAYDPARGQDVAIKLLEHGRAARQAREASAQQRLDHPHICPVYEVGRHDDTPCIVMRFIDGGPINQVLVRATLETRLRVFLQVVDAVAYAHRMGVVHRDIKPGNILVESTGPDDYHAWLVDFGLAKAVDDNTLTIQGEAFGTPGFMAPEQARGERGVDALADVFSLGAVLFDLICGRPPFQSESTAQVLLKTVGTDAPSLRSVDSSAPERLTRIVAQCLERQPSLRYQSAEALGDDLRAFLAGGHVKARHYGLWTRARRLTAANPGATLAIGGLFIVALISALIALWTDIAGERFTAEQAALAGQFSDGARRIANQMALIHARPLHDTTPARNELAQQLAALEARIPNSGPARQTALRALGRVQAAIGAHDQALIHLLAALESGDDDVELRGLLGRTYAQLYFEAEERALLLPDPVHRQRELARARESYLDPAVGHLRSASGPDAEQLLLNQALLAWLSNDQASALAILRQAAEETNWPIAPLMLMGRIQLTNALERSRVSDLAAALAQYVAAHETFGRVLETARSYPEAYRADCRTIGLIADLEMQGVRTDDDLFSEARTVCENAVTSDPTNPESLLSAAVTYERVASTLNARRQDVTRWIDEASAFAYRASEIAPEDPDSYRVLAGLNLTTARWRVEGNSVSTLREATRLATRAAELDSGRPETLTVLAQAHASLGRALYLQGEDGDPEYSAAVSTLQQIVPISPVPIRAKARLAENLAWQGYYRYIQGRDAEAVLTRAMEVAREATAEAPDNVEAWVALGYAAWTLAEYRFLLDTENGAVAEEAYRAYKRVLEIDPTRFASRYNIQGPLAILTRVRLDQGRSAADLLETKRALAEALRDDLGDRGDLRLMFAEILMLEAWQKLVVGSMDGALALFGEARVEAIEALAGIDRIEAALLLSEMAVLENTWRAQAGLPLNTLAADIRRLSALSRQHDELTLLRARLGELHLIAAGQSTDAEERHRAEAVRLLTEALTRNPLLRARHEASLNRAQTASME